MAQPSTARNFFGRVVDRILPGQQYNTQTGQYSNVGKGLAGLGARLAATAFAGPAVGALVGKGAGYLIDRSNGSVGDVQRESVGPYGSVAPGQVGSPSPISISNLGLGPQTPGNSWAGYLQSAGSVNNFGNNSFDRGNAYTNWSPSSQWGQQVVAQPAAQGSVAGFGNSVGDFAGGGSRGGGTTGGRGSSMPGIFGGRLANEGILEVRQRWAGR